MKLQLVSMPSAFLLVARQCLANAFLIYYVLIQCFCESTFVEEKKYSFLCCTLSTFLAWSLSSCRLCPMWHFVYVGTVILGLANSMIKNGFPLPALAVGKLIELSQLSCQSEVRLFVNWFASQRLHLALEFLAHPFSEGVLENAKFLGLLHILKELRIEGVYLLLGIMVVGSLVNMQPNYYDSIRFSRQETFRGGFPLPASA